MVLWIWSSAKRLYIFLAEDVKIVVRNLQTVSNKRQKGQFRHWYVFTLRLLHSICVSSWQFIYSVYSRVARIFQAKK